MLIERGLKAGECPEAWNLLHPEIIEDIHRAYFEAGSQVVLTNTFGANRLKLNPYGMSDKAEEINRKAVELALAIRPGRETDCYVAGDIGPTGKFLKPLGPYEFIEFKEIFAEQARYLALAGADFICIETMFDPEEAKAALQGALGITSLPVIITMTFDKTPRGFFTPMGLGPTEAAQLLEKNGAGAIGANCSTGPDEMLELIKILRKASRLPIIAKPNAGKPIIKQGKAFYSKDSRSFAHDMQEVVKAGANGIGGCCGTDPSYITVLAQLLNKEGRS
jgi:5-methyltetrahydrofolate--homocysteine methyltransferase